MTGEIIKPRKSDKKCASISTASLLGVKDSPIYLAFGTVLLPQPFISKLEVVVPNERVWLGEGGERRRVAGCKDLILFLQQAAVSRRATPGKEKHALSKPSIAFRANAPQARKTTPLWLGRLRTASITARVNLFQPSLE